MIHLNRKRSIFALSSKLLVTVVVLSVSTAFQATAGVPSTTIGSETDEGTGQNPKGEFRKPVNEADLRYWLENMVVHHRFTVEEVSAATGLSSDEVAIALRKYQLFEAKLPERRPNDPLRVLPYPGGRHPRIGFLEGAIDPQRETKISVFLPWDSRRYVVVDVPEAVFSNLGLIYLAHTHIPTVWDEKSLELPKLEWNRHPDGTLGLERKLPNGIIIGAKVTPQVEAVRMALFLRNGTPEPLTGLRVQNCVMLKSAAGFESQTLTNKTFQKPFAVVRSLEGRRWVITAWDHCGRVWGNDQVPCIHSDPVFPDCAPGQTVWVRGWLSFYEGEDIAGELKRLGQVGWNQASE